MGRDEQATADFITFCDYHKMRITARPSSERNSGLDFFAQRMVNQITTSTRKGKPMRFASGYIEDPSFNAWAATYNGTDLIGITTGVPVALSRLMNMLLLMPPLFREVGDQHSLDRQPYFTGPPLSPENISTLPAVELRDKARAELAANLAALAEHMVISHEWTHITNGHVDWLNMRHNLCFVDELNMVGAGDLSGLDLQTLEWDADCGASQETLMVATEGRQIVNGNESRFTFPDQNRAFVSLSRSLEAWGFASHICYRIFSDPLTSFNIAAFLEADHPPGVIRTRFNRFLAMEIIEHLSDHSGQDLAMSIMRGVAQAEAGWSALFQTPAIDLADPQHDVIHREFLDVLTDNWSNLYDGLTQYTRGGQKLTKPG